ncbi:HlyD family secretion protein [Tellurirhabdus rosea]|uniref:HlyD family secretion protein n=1 Tax=Tellurirhabdus rosea TaxID=2674997 RepID=UPI002253E97A|nr:HlyD family secretion protein [Tellurirhabdus rosea]
MATEQQGNAASPVRKYLPRVILLILLAAGGLYGFRSYRHSQHYETTDNAQIEGSTAPVLARVAGYVQGVDVEDYAVVRKGQPLVTIDPQEYEVALRQAEADYQQTLADLQTARADLQTARANRQNVAQNRHVTESNAAVQAARRDKARQDLQRDQNLFQGQSLTQKQLEDSRSNADVQSRQYEASVQQVRLAQTSEAVSTAAIARAEAAIKKVEALLKVKEAAVENARLRLSYATISAPISGKIGKKNVVAGQYVQPGQALFTIVNDSTFWVIANFKETQLEKMRVGQPVEVSVDAYPNLKVEGRVTSLSEATGARFALLPPDNASGNFVKVTQRVPVKIEILNPAKYKELLRAGLSVEAAVNVQ